MNIKTLPSATKKINSKLVSEMADDGFIYSSDEGMFEKYILNRVIYRISYDVAEGLFLDKALKAKLKEIDIHVKTTLFEKINGTLNDLDKSTGIVVLLENY